MTRVFVTRGSSSNPNRSTLPGSSSSSSSVNIHVASNVKEEEHGEEVQESVLVDELLDCSISGENKASKCDISLPSPTEGSTEEVDILEVGLRSRDENMERGLRKMELPRIEESSGDSVHMGTCSSCPPPPPIPPPKPSISNLNPKRSVSGSSNGVRIGQPRRAAAWPVVLPRTSPSGSRPSSPRSHGESEGYNSSDEQNPYFGSSYDDLERERQFDIDIRHAKGFEVKRMVADGNCLFRAVADQVYGDPELYDLARQMCIDYMEHERDHFSQFITEGFTSYCKRKRRDKVYGNNAEIQALSEMYNRPIHIYSYSTEPINIFHGTYNTETPPIRLSYHHGNHYNSLVDPRRLSIGAGLGFSSLTGTNVDKDKVKAAIKAQQDQQIDNALLAEGRFYSDLELTEKEIERMVMEASRAEYLGGDKLKQQLSRRGSSTSGAEPSSSGARPSGSSETKAGEREQPVVVQEAGLSSSMQVVLSMGFAYLQAIEAYSIFGDDVDSMIDYLVETDSTSRRKGKATE